MTDPVDPQHRRRPAFDKDNGTSGQGYSLDEERRLGRDTPAGSVAPSSSSVEEEASDTPESGRRASFDPETGEVHGSGASAGGGHEGEDPDDDRVGGAGTPITGALPLGHD